MSVTKIVPLTNVGLLSAAIGRAHDRPSGLPGMVVMYGASGLGKSVGAAFAANQHRAYYVECRDTWSKKAFLLAILREMSIQPERTFVADGRPSPTAHREAETAKAHRG